MNEGQVSAEVLESASQGGSESQLSNETLEILSQTATTSAAQFSSLVIEVIEFVPRSRASLTPVMN